MTETLRSRTMAGVAMDSTPVRPVDPQARARARMPETHRLGVMPAVVIRSTPVGPR